jgi:hypothetical protein
VTIVSAPTIRVMFWGAAWFPDLAVCPSAGHSESTFPQATLSFDGMLVTTLLATVWHTSVDKKISRCIDGVARKESCTV